MQVILDRSGSMSGGPWRQVQSAVTKMIEMTADNKRIFMKVMIYNDQVRTEKQTGLELEKLQSSSSSGCT